MLFFIFPFSVFKTAAVKPIVLALGLGAGSYSFFKSNQQIANEQYKQQELNRGDRYKEAWENSAFYQAQRGVVDHTENIPGAQQYVDQGIKLPSQTKPSLQQIFNWGRASKFKLFNFRKRRNYYRRKPKYYCKLVKGLNFDSYNPNFPPKFQRKTFHEKTNKPVQKFTKSGIPYLDYYN